MTSIEIITQLSEDIGCLLRRIERDGLTNSKAHFEKIDKIAEAIHALALGEEWKVPL